MCLNQEFLLTNQWHFSGSIFSESRLVECWGFASWQFWVPTAIIIKIIIVFPSLLRSLLRAQRYGGKTFSRMLSIENCVARRRIFRVSFIIYGSWPDSQPQPENDAVISKGANVTTKVQRFKSRKWRSLIRETLENKLATSSWRRGKIAELKMKLIKFKC